MEGHELQSDAVSFTVHVQTHRYLHQPPHYPRYCIFPHDVTPLYYLHAPHFKGISQYEILESFRGVKSSRRIKRRSSANISEKCAFKGRVLDTPPHPNINLNKFSRICLSIYGT